MVTFLWHSRKGGKEDYGDNQHSGCKRLTVKQHEGTFSNNKKILYLDWDNSYMGIYT